MNSMVTFILYNRIYSDLGQTDTPNGSATCPRASMLNPVVHCFCNINHVCIIVTRMLSQEAIMSVTGSHRLDNTPTGPQGACKQFS